MLKPQRQSDFILHDFPPVFGKPWYWHRTSGTMESTRSLAQVIMEMQAEIKKLEDDKRANREEFCRQESFGDFPAGQPTRPMDAGIENPYANLRRNASAPALDVKYTENTVMTVRRYSVSNMAGAHGREGSTNPSRRSDSGWGRLQEGVNHGCAARLETEARSKKLRMQDLVHKNRAKVKTVTFLLPVDDIYTNRPVLSKQQEDSSTADLDSITETDY